MSELTFMLFFVRYIVYFKFFFAISAGYVCNLAI